MKPGVSRSPATVSMFTAGQTPLAVKGLDTVRGDDTGEPRAVNERNRDFSPTRHQTRRERRFGTIPKMERNWCCPEFQEHASTDGKRGFRAELVWRGRRPFSCFLEFRKPDNKPLDPSAGGVGIKICPRGGSVG